MRTFTISKDFQIFALWTWFLQFLPLQIEIWRRPLDRNEAHVAGSYQRSETMFAVTVKRMCERCLSPISFERLILQALVQSIIYHVHCGQLGCWTTEKVVDPLRHGNLTIWNVPLLYFCAHLKRLWKKKFFVRGWRLVRLNGDPAIELCSQLQYRTKMLI